ncbi:MAG TPA: hypothetical protein VK157_04795, partial [Phycisphaerales bacterium]|nr:hypothetical protein [Phycisphaerales bacterium]
MTYSTAAVILALAHAAAAIAQPAPRVVARPAASSTTPGFTGIMTAIAIAPDGRVAFNADVRELAPGGGFVITRPPLVERDGQLVTAYAGLVSPTDSFVTVVGVDELGNVLVRGAPPPAVPLARAYAIDRPVGGPLRIVTRGQVAPGIPDRTVNIISNPTPIGRQEVRYLPPLFKFPFNVSLMPNTAPTAAMLRGSENGAVLLTTQTQLNTPDAPPVSAANIPTDVNANGDFLDFGSSSIQLYRDGVVRSSPP